MLFENFPLPLPWYPRLEMQDRFRQNVTTDPRILQLAPYDGVLPFQFAKEMTSEMPISWSIMCAKKQPLEYYMNGGQDEVIADLTPFILDVLEVTSLSDKDYFTFPEDRNSYDMIGFTLDDGLPPGCYYMMMEFEEGLFSGNHVSELFRVPDDRFSWTLNSLNCNYPCLKWSNNTDIAPMHYDSESAHVFFNKLYLDTFITASEPVIEITALTDGLGEEFPARTKAKIRYRLSAIVPDFIKVALFVMEMHENKAIYLEHGFRSGEIKNPEISATLSPDGAFSYVEIIFEQMSLLIDTQCAELMAEPEPVLIDPGITCATEYCSDSGDLLVACVSVPDGVFGNVEYSLDAGATYTECYARISRADLIAGIHVTIATGLSGVLFRVGFFTFTSRVGETDGSAPIASC